MSKSQARASRYTWRVCLLSGLVCLWIACTAGCAGHSNGGGPEVLPKKFPGGGAPAGGAKGASTTPP